MFISKMLSENRNSFYRHFTLKKTKIKTVSVGISTENHKIKKTMKNLGLIMMIGLFSIITVRAQESKNFTKQFVAVEQAPLSDVIGELKTKEDYVYDEIYYSKMPLDGFEVNVGISFLPFVFAKYKENGSLEKFDKILTQLKTLPYNFEIKTDHKSYEKAVEITSKSTGKKVADLLLDNFGMITIDFASKM